MKKVAKIVGLYSRPLQERYLTATPEERESLLTVVDREKDWMIDKMREEAGKLGANALHILTMEEAGAGEQIVAALLDTEADRDAEALALWCPNRSEDKWNGPSAGAERGLVAGTHGK